MVTEPLKSKSIYQQSIVCNLALGFEPEIEYPHKWDVLHRYADAGLSYVSLHVATDATSLERTIHYISFLTEKIKTGSNYFHLITSPQDIAQAKSEKKLGVGFVFQGTGPLAKRLEMIDSYYQLGVRSMILSYNVRNDVGDGIAEATDVGLSKFGINVVKRMNAVGMLIDCSHSGYKTSMDTMSISTSPVIFSHSNAYTIQPHVRNVKDDQLKACAHTDGLIGINGIGVLLGDEKATPQKCVEHIDYISQLIGPKHVALGLDEIYFPELMEDFLTNNSVMYPQDYTTSVTSKRNWNCLKPHQLPEVIALLIQRGYSDSDIKGILGENYLRVIRKTWR